MTLLKKRLAETEKKLEELKSARRAAQKASRAAYKQTKADYDRKIVLIGEAILRKVERGEFDEAELRLMMDEYLSRPADRALFKLDEESNT